MHHHCAHPITTRPPTPSTMTLTLSRLLSPLPCAVHPCSVVSQFRKGAPAAYGVLRYQGAPAALPRGPLVQPQEGAEQRVWNITTTMSLQAHPLLVSPGNSTAAKPYFPNGFLTTQRLPPGQPDKRFVIQSTQPLLEANGILRWALDNAAHAKTPPCASVLDLAYEDDGWAAKNAIQPSWDGLTGYFKWGADPNSVTGSNVTLQVRRVGWVGVGGGGEGEVLLRLCCCFCCPCFPYVPLHPSPCPPRTSQLRNCTPHHLSFFPNPPLERPPPPLPRRWWTPPPTRMC